MPNTRTKLDIGAWPTTPTGLVQIQTVLDGQVKQLFVGAGAAAEVLDAASTPTIDASVIETLSEIDCSRGSIAINLPDISAASGGSVYTESHRSGDGFLKILCLRTVPSPGGNTATVDGTGFSTVTLTTANPTVMFVWQGSQWSQLSGPPSAVRGLAPFYGLADPLADNAFSVQQNVYDPYPGVAYGLNRLLFGSDSAEPNGRSSQISKLIFSNMAASADDGSFSAGICDNSTGAWALANRGLASVRFGTNNQASGVDSSALSGHDNVITTNGNNSSVIAGNSLTNDQPNCAMTQAFHSTEGFRNAFVKITPTNGSTTGLIDNVNHYVLVDMSGTAGAPGTATITLPTLSADNDNMVLNFAIHCEAPGDSGNTCVVAGSGGDVIASSSTSAASGSVTLCADASVANTYSSFCLIGEAGAGVWWMDIGGTSNGGTSGAQDLAKTLHTNQVSGGSPTTTALFPTTTYIGGVLASINLDTSPAITVHPTDPPTVAGPLGIVGNTLAGLAPAINVIGGQSTGAGTAGGSVNILGGSSTSGNGARVIVAGGQSSTAIGGQVTIQGGNGATLSGSVQIATQTAAVSGAVTIQTGLGSGGNSGNFSLGTGVSSGGSSGAVLISTGGSSFAGASGGDITVSCGNAGAAGTTAGKFIVTGGSAVAVGSIPGNVSITAGTAVINGITGASLTLATGLKSTSTGNTGAAVLQTGDVTNTTAIGGTGQVTVQSGSVTDPLSSHAGDTNTGLVYIHSGNNPTSSATVRAGHIQLDPGYTDLAATICGEVILGSSAAPAGHVVRGIHLVALQSSAPTFSAGIALGAGASDTAGLVTSAPAGTSTITFRTPFLSTPAVIMQPWGLASAGLVAPVIVTASTDNTKFTFDNQNGAGSRFSYMCIGTQAIA